MKKFALITSAAVLAAAGSAFGQLTLSLTTPAGDSGVGGYESGPAMWDGSGGSFSIDLMVRAHVTGAGALGLTTFDGALTDDGSGAFAPDLLSNFDAIGFPGIPGDDFQGRAGMTPDYRATIGANNADPGNGAPGGPGRWTFLPLSISATGVAAAVTGTDDIYRFRWTTSDPTARTVVISVGANGYGYQSSTGLVQASNIERGSFTIEIVPAPGAAALLGLGGLVAIRRRR